MKKFLVLGLGMVAMFAVVSTANAQFAVGDRVQAATNLNVRSSPGGALLGVQAAGALGIIVGGPVITSSTPTSSFYAWWNVNYDIAPDGWSMGYYLAKVSTSTPSAVCGDLNGDKVIDVTDVSLIINYAFRGVTIPAGVRADVNGDGVVNVVDVNLIIDTAFRGAPVPTGCVPSAPNQPPVVDYFSVESPVTLGSLTTGHIFAIDPDGDSLTYWMNWGDGRTDGPNPIGQRADSILHLYQNPGTYYASLSVSDGRGGWVYGGPVQVVVNPTSTPNQPPVITNFSVNPAAPGSLTSAFIRAIDPNNDSLSYWINWGDGQSGGPFSGPYGVYPTHVYANQGTYYASSSVYDGRGGWAFGGPVAVSIYSTSTPSQPINPLYQQSTTPPPTVLPKTITYQCGDLNKDGTVNVSDVALMRSYWTGGVLVPSGVNADMNGDGVAADILDYSLLNNYVTKGGVAPTCGGASGGTKTGTLSPSASVLGAMQVQLDAIKSQLVNILLQL